MNKVEIVKKIPERVDKNGRRWIQDHEVMFDKKKENLLRNKECINSGLIIQYIREMRTGDGSKYSQRRSISKSRASKIMSTLVYLNTWLNNRKFTEITETDMRDFIEKLDEDIILQPINSKPYAETTKATIKKIIRKFWKWLKGDNKFYPPEVIWISTFEPIPQKDIYSLDDIQILVDSFNTFKMKAFVWVLFDTGLRVNEILNLRIKDIIMPQPGRNYVSLNIRDEIAKGSYGRKIGLYHSHNFLLKFIDKHHQEPNNKEAFIFDYTYDTIRTKLYKRSRKILGKSITPHRIRETSATYFASRIKSYQNYCYRFGWSLNSKVPDRYYQRAGVKSHEIMQEIITSEKTFIQAEAMNEKIINNDLVLENKALSDKANIYKNKYREIEKYEQSLMELIQIPEVKNLLSGIMKKNLNEDTRLIESARQNVGEIR